MRVFERMNFARSVSFTVILALAGCAHPQTTPPVPQTAEALMEARKQKEIAFVTQQSEIARLQLIGDRLRIGSAPLCSDLVPRFGWRILNQFSFKPENREIATAAYLLGDRLKVVHLTEDGPAERAGIQAGDELVRADDVDLLGADAAVKFGKIAKDSLTQGKAVKLEVLRNGLSVPVELAGVAACNYPVSLLHAEKLNASTNGQRIVVSEGLVRFTRDDTELALVIAHEMSHDIRRHFEAQQKNADVGRAMGTLVDILAALGGSYGNVYSSLGAKMGREAYSQEFEAEADYVSLYVMALSGYDITHAPDFWRRIATVKPEEIDKGYTHPSTAKRFVALEAAVQEIHGKQTSGAELRPQTKKN